MSRNEFTAKTKREAYARSGGVCEAERPLYGFAEGQKCQRSLTGGVEYDHRIMDAISKDRSLENCCCACPPCHLFKTRTHDIPMVAKSNRVRDKARSIRTRRGNPLPGTKASGIRKRMNGNVERW